MCAADLAALSESLRTYLLFVAEESLEPDLRAKLGASDLVQLTLLKAHLARDTFRGSTAEEYRGWLRRILLRVLVNHRRDLRDSARRRVDREVPLTDASGVASQEERPSQYAVRDEQQHRLRQAVAKLPTEYQRVLTLRFDHDLSFAEIGRHMGHRSEDAARMLLNRATEKLREVMSEPEG